MRRIAVDLVVSGVLVGLLQVLELSLPDFAEFRSRVLRDGGPGGTRAEELYLGGLGGEDGSAGCGRVAVAVAFAIAFAIAVTVAFAVTVTVAFAVVFAVVVAFAFAVVVAAVAAAVVVKDLGRDDGLRLEDCGSLAR